MIAAGEPSSAENKSSIGAGREKRETPPQQGHAPFVQMRTSRYQQDCPTHSTSQSQEGQRSQALSCHEGREEGDKHWNGANGDEGRDAHASRGDSRYVTSLGECHQTSHQHHHGQVTMLDVKEATAKARPTGEKKQRGCNSQAEERQGQSIGCPGRIQGLVCNADRAPGNGGTDDEQEVTTRCVLREHEVSLPQMQMEKHRNHAERAGRARVQSTHTNYSVCVLERG